MRQQQNTQLQPLLEGALLAAIAVVLVLAGFYLPVLGPLLVFVWPTPFAVVTFRHDIRLGIMSVVVAGLVSGLFVGVLTALGMVLVAGSTGITFGYAFRNKLKGTTTLLLGAGAVLVSAALSMGLAFIIMKVNPIEMYREMIAQSLSMTAELYSKLGMEEQVGPALDQFKQATELIFGRLLPGTVIIAVITQAWVNFSVMRAVFSRLGHSVPELPPFSRWQVPYAAVWVFVAAYGLLWLGQTRELEAATALGQNLNLVMMMVFLVQGMSFAYFFLERWNFARIGIILILAAGALNPLLSQVLFFAGMFEAVIQYRKGLIESEEENTGGPPKPGKKRKK